MTEQREYPVYLRVGQEERGGDAYEPGDRNLPTKSNLLLFFDCETTRDTRQELIFGNCEIHSGNNVIRRILFTGKRPDKELAIARQWAKQNQHEIMTVEEFVTGVFYPYAQKQQATVVGFNVPFDLARIAAEFEPKKKIMASKGKWTLCLLPRDDPRFSKTPRVSVERLDSTKAFIQFTGAKGWKYYRGAFVDLRTLSFALTGKKHTLDSAAKDFGCDCEKTRLPEESRITSEFLDYGWNDVKLTAALYQAAMKRYNDFGLPLPPWRIYSSASLAKETWRMRGIKPPKLAARWIGRIMAAFYAGKVEIRYVDKEVPGIRVLDYTSQYPSLWCLMQMERFLTAKKLVPRRATEEVIRWINSLSRSDLLKRRTWRDPRMTALCEVELHGATVPIRSSYRKPGSAPTIGWNHAYTEPGLTMPYFAADLIAAKLLDGGTKFTVKEATIFEPEGKQDVKEIEILGVKVGTDQDVIQTLAEARMEEKARGDAGMDSRQKGLKTITNSGAYGIFVEVNREETDHEVLIHGIQDEPFLSDAAEYEAPGNAYCPLIGAAITSAAHLLLALAEDVTREAGGEVVYSDTDSIFVRPAHVAGVVAKAFDALNPYSRPEAFLKDETNEKCPQEEFRHEADDVIFYGLSSKRYCLLARRGDDIHVFKEPASDHGLGGFKAPGERSEFIRQVWADIVRDGPGAARLYTGMPAIGDFSLSSPLLLARTEDLGDIPPFSFMTARLLEVDGSKTNRSELVPFISKLTPKEAKRLMEMPNPRTWSSIVSAFAKHRDRKYLVNADGTITRHHVSIRAYNIYGLGKETHRYEDGQVLGLTAVGGHAQVHVDYVRRVLALTRKDAEVMGIPWETIRRWKARARKGDVLTDGNGAKARTRLAEGLARLDAWKRGLDR